MEIGHHRNIDVQNTPFLRALMGLFGVGLVVMFFVSYFGESANPSWFDWCDLALGSLGIYAAAVGPRMTLAAGTLSAYVFGGLGLALWIVVLASGVSTWMTWITFALALILVGGAVAKTSALGIDLRASLHGRTITPTPTY